MPSIKDIRRRIRATRNMQQIFKAMEMVAGARLRRAQARAQAATPYARKITEVLGHLSSAASELEHPLFEAREVKVTALVVVTADRGFAGTYNIGVLRAAEQRLRAAQPGAIQFVVIGRKGRDYFKRRHAPVLKTWTDLPSEADLAFARTLTEYLTGLFTSGQVDRVEVLYTHFVNALVRRLHTDVFLPIRGAEGAAPGDRGTLFEPDPETIFAELLPRYATAKLYAAMADAFASEHSARMVAMGSARKNAGELVDSLTLVSNRLRQAVITKELSEIVAGADALT